MMAFKSCNLVMAVFAISLINALAFSSLGQRVSSRVSLSMKSYLGAGPIFIAGR